MVTLYFDYKLTEQHITIALIYSGDMRKTVENTPSLGRDTFSRKKGKFKTD